MYTSIKTKFIVNDVAMESHISTLIRHPNKKNDIAMHNVTISAWMDESSLTKFISIRF